MFSDNFSLGSTYIVVYLRTQQHTISLPSNALNLINEDLDTMHSS